VAERTVMLRIGANIAGLQSQLRAAQNAVGEFSKRSTSYIERNAASIDTLSNSVGAVGVSLVGLAAGAVTRFAQFDKAMSAVAATGDDARGSLDQLREAAIEAGADTAFSATEAAGAIEQLAKAGLSSADILGGGLKGALALAAAGEIEVGEAAEIAASAMTQFNLSGSDVGHVADLLAAGAGKAQGGVTDMGQALNQAGLIAGQVGLSIEETTGALSAMASAGLIGSDAGTSLKTALVALSSPSKAAREEMEKYGISLYDANGNTLSLSAVAGQLQTAFANQSTETRNAALATIFGTDALRTANVLYAEGAEGINEWTSAVNDQGYAVETAAAQTDNLVGDLERLGGSIDTVLIQSGSGANDVLRQLAQSAEGVVDAIGEIPAPVLSATTLIAGAGGLALLGVAGMGKLAVAVNDTRVAVQALGISAKTAGVAIGGIGAAVAVGTIALSTWAQNAAEAAARTDELQNTLDEFGKTTDNTLSTINARLAENQNDWIDNLLGDDPESLIDRAERVGLAVEDLQGYILGNEEAVRKVTAATRDHIAAQGDDLTAMDIRAQAGRFLTDALDAEAGSLTDAQKAAAQKAVADEAAGVAADDLAGATAEVTESTAVYTDALMENIEAQREAAGIVLGLRDAENAAEAAIDNATESLKDNGKTLDVTTEKGRANRSALDDIAESGWDLIESMRANGASQTDLQKTMGTTRDRFIEVAQKMGLSKAEAKQLANELNLIPKNVKTDISADGSAARTEGKRTKDYINGLYAEIQVAADTGTAYAQANAIQRYINGLNATITVRDRHVSSGLPGSRQGGITRASGGPIPMIPGAAQNVDSVPVLAMPDEHMWTKSEVAAVGGHSAMYRLRAAALAGELRGYAAGGPIAPSYLPRFTSPPPVAVGSPSVSAVAPSRSLVVNNYGRDLSVRELVHAQRALELNEPTEVYA
jgi:TP901 family phage tail tape measure protein